MENPCGPSSLSLSMNRPQSHGQQFCHYQAMWILLPCCYDKIPNESSLWDKVFILEFQRDTVLCGGGDTAAGREGTGSWVGSWQVGSIVSTRGTRVKQEVSQGCKPSACASDHFLSETPPHKDATAFQNRPAGGQVSEHMNLWDTFHIKPEHCLEWSQQEAIISTLLCLCCVSVPFGGYSSWSGKN